MKKRIGYETEIMQSYKTATGIIKFPGKGRVQKKMFRNTVYCSAKTKAEKWIEETIAQHREAMSAMQAMRIQVRELETEWWVSVKLEDGFKLKSVELTRDEAMEVARIWAEQGQEVIVEEAVAA